MNKIIINKGKGMRFTKTSSSLPEELDYENLMDKLDKPIVEDLRKAKKDYSLEQIDNTKPTEKLTKDTVIPIPGLLINYEDSQQSTPPRPTDGPSCWNGGPQWGGEY